MKNWLEKVFGKTVWYVPLLVLASLLISYIWFPGWFQDVILLASGYVVGRFLAEPISRWVTLKVIKPVVDWVKGLF